MSTYSELKLQAEELLKQAEAIRAEERVHVVQSVRDLIVEWNITASDLNMKATKARKKLPAKYRCPNTGNEWCGKGAMPRWLSSYLQAGHTKEQFLV